MFEKYYASEIDPYAIKVAMLNHPDIIQLGDIRTIKGVDLPLIDLLVFGFPCQDLSSIGKGAGLNGERSGLFYEALRLLAEVKPKYFIAENVASMPLSERNKISELLGVEPIMINSALFASGQCRKRLFWCNFKVAQPTDQGIKLQDIITNGFVDRDKSHALLTNQLPETEVGLERYLYKSTGQLVFKEKYFAELDKPVPNPFKEKTTISYTLPETYAKAQLVFHNSQGKLIQSVELTGNGEGQLNVFADDLTSGIYTYTLVVDGKIIQTKKMIKQ